MSPFLDPAQLAADGIVGVVIGYCDNNGIPRSRTVPLAGLARAAEVGVGITHLFAVFDSADVITYEADGMSTPSGDVRLIPVIEQLVPLAGQPGLAWAPGRVVNADGSPWPYDQRTVLERQVERAAAQGLSVLTGYELEFYVALPDGAPAHHGPAYGPAALLELGDFAARLLTDLAAGGLQVGQLHAEYGLSQVEIALPALDPVATADAQLLAREIVRAAARASGLRVSYAPLVETSAAGNGWHLHTSIWRDGRNLLAGPVDALDPVGEAFVAGLLRELPALAAVAAPSGPSLLRRRAGFFAGAYVVWGVHNREAPLRFVPSTPLLGDDAANVELKTSDASGNPYLAQAAVIAAGLAGIRDGLRLPEPVQVDPAGIPGLTALPATPAQAQAALMASAPVREALGEPLLAAFLAVRRSDAAAAEGLSPDEVVAAHRWRY